MKTEIMKPDWAFHPDQWSFVFLQGLNKILHEWRGKSVWEVGVGTGNNIIELYNKTEVRKWYISDLNPNCTLLAYENILNSVPFNQGNIIPLYGVWDLVTPQNDSTAEAPKVDIIFGCIPQIPAEINLLQADNMAHYYNPEKYLDSHLNILGLGLNEALLKRSKILVRDSVVLNLCGRPGLEKLCNMFTDNNYTPKIIHKDIVPQDIHTSLSSLVSFEEQGLNDFEFFLDMNGRIKLNAHEAKYVMHTGRNVYHMIYVIKGVVT